MDDHATDITLTIMIRIYLDICKAFHMIKHLDDYQFLSAALRSDLSELPPCPHCGAPSSSYSHNGSHERHLVSYVDGCICDRMVSLPFPARYPDSILSPPHRVTLYPGGDLYE